MTAFLKLFRSRGTRYSFLVLAVYAILYWGVKRSYLFDVGVDPTDLLGMQILLMLVICRALALTLIPAVIARKIISRALS